MSSEYFFEELHLEPTLKGLSCHIIILKENYKSLLLTIKLYRTVSYDVGHNLQQLHGFIEYKG